ncbi:hypothetical protein [Kitasatospora herbaricolor]|uniref:Uncharacterized protein n=1 Tax=Kitasatospora herbaricolor TaxID=68217 RepID=A0ABZ1WJ16_9ACTN|nr:hypothetical protein [Kitasatospora herbaricolor]
MNEDAAPPPTPVTLVRDPETLLDQDGVRLSHAGILNTPAGLFTVLALENPALHDPDRAPAQGRVSLTRPGSRHATLALPQVCDQAQAGVEFLVCSFGPVEHPHELHLVVEWPQLPRAVARPLTGPPAPGPGAVLLLAEPALLTSDQAWPALWHCGLPAVAGVLFSHLEATAPTAGDLTGPQWDIGPNRPPHHPRPLHTAFTGPAAGPATASWSASPHHVALDTVLLPPSGTVPPAVTWSCPPLGITTTHSVTEPAALAGPPDQHPPTGSGLTWATA